METCLTKKAPATIKEAVNAMMGCDLVLKMESDAMEPRIGLGAMLYCQQIETDIKLMHFSEGYLKNCVYVVQTTSGAVTVGELFLRGLFDSQKPHIQVVYEHGSVRNNTFYLNEIKGIWRILFIEPKDEFPEIWEVK